MNESFVGTFVPPPLKCSSRLSCKLRPTEKRRWTGGGGGETGGDGRGRRRDGGDGRGRRGDRRGGETGETGGGGGETGETGGRGGADLHADSL